MPTAKGRKPIPIEDRFWSKVRKTKDCWEWLGSKNPKGYGHISHREKIAQAHRVSWAMHNGELPPGLHILHKCDNPSCVRPDHLFLGKDKENAVDRERKGRGASKLTPDIIHKIRVLYQEGKTQKEIGEMLGKSKMTISRIVRGLQGAHGTGPIAKPFEGLRGERNGSSKLTKAKAQEIREARQKGETMRSLAARFGVGVSRINDIVHDRGWL